ncbi:MAG TPA: hypothetical protein VMP01_04260 [Pirellulaceae bacterium]|nr:hypothetical protein [Pirellulaceae bacterium]
MLRKDRFDLAGRQIAVVLALLSGNLLLVACLWNFRFRSPVPHSGDLAAIYLSQGQYVLLAAWCAWGTGRTTVRWLIALASLAAVTITFNHFAARSLGRTSDAFFDLSVGGAVVLGGWYALFLPLRQLLGWRLTWDASPAGVLRGQFRVRHWLGWSAAFGVPLATAKLVYPGELTVECLFFCVMLALPALPLVVVSFRAAFSRRPWLWSTAAVAFSILVGIAEESLVFHVLMGGIGVSTWQVRWMQIQQCCGMNLGLAAGLLGNLLILRLLGMRFATGRKAGRVQLASASADGPEWMPQGGAALAERG